MNEKPQYLWHSLRNVLIMIIAIAALILAYQGLLQLGVDKIIMPPPDNVAADFMTAAQARRYQGAINELSEDLKQQVKPEDLKAIMDQIEQKHDGIDQSDAQDSQEQGDSATVKMQVKLNDGSQQDVSVPLKRENKLWTVSSLAPLQALTGQ